MKLTIPFGADDVPRWAAHYGDPHQDDAAIQAGNAARERGSMTQEEFKCISEWKLKKHWRYQCKNIERNSAENVRACTKRAFMAHDPVRCIDLLSDLDGVQCAAGSALLHLYHRDVFPIADRFALMAVGVPKHLVDIGDSEYRKAWPEYVRVFREIVRQSAVDARSLDRALWGYGKVHYGA
ncbi:MAG: hypothetical protein IT436_14130 [Phycisphaerales bacterium]|nr:hypothetical protein [Phycisphaerales bacterium]